MPTTRRQTAIAEGRISPDEKPKPTSKPHAIPRKKHSFSKARKPKTEPGVQDQTDQDQGLKDTKVAGKHVHEDEKTTEGLPPKKSKTARRRASSVSNSIYKPGTIERGHIYFFYRPRVQLEEAHSIDDVRNFHMLLVPRPPEFAQSKSDISGDVEKQYPAKAEETEMKILSPGADAVPAPDDRQTKKKFYRLITVGKKKLPDPESPSSSGRRKEVFWAIVTAVGDDLDSLEEGLGAKSYETKTRGTRHEEPARLVARGGYAIVNSDAEMPSQRETHLGYHVSHPRPQEMGDVQLEFGIYSASSFIVQVRNPLAPPTSPMQAHAKGAQYPEWIMRGVFGASEGGEEHSRGRESYGLRFSSCGTPELLDYKGAQLLLIAAREGEEGLEKSLGAGRGLALSEAEEREGHESLKQVFGELGLDLDKFPVESLEGSWI